MAALTPEHIAELDTFLVELNRAAAAAILPLFRAEHGLIDKGGLKGFDPVTEADKGAERAIRQLISQHHPGHGVIGEEYGEDRPDAEFVWVLDPVDGTRAFIAGLPLWTTLIGLRHQGKPVLGSIGQSFLGDSLFQREVSLHLFQVIDDLLHFFRRFVRHVGVLQLLADPVQSFLSPFRGFGRRP